MFSTGSLCFGQTYLGAIQLKPLRDIVIQTWLGQVRLSFYLLGIASYTVGGKISMGVKFGLPCVFCLKTLRTFEFNMQRKCHFSSFKHGIDALEAL